MSYELAFAIQEIKDELPKIDGISRAMLGQPIGALNDSSPENAIACVFLMTGSPDNTSAYTSTKELHQVELRLYWLLTPGAEELVELNVARMWDRLMEHFYDDDGDRNLNERVTVALLGGVGGNLPYQTGFERISDRIHRILRLTLELELDTHAVE